MKKIAILTQPLHTNYGGTLQAYALQKVIADMGADVVTINYQWKNKSTLHFILAVLKNHLINRKYKYPFLEKENVVREKYHSEFIKQNIKRSERIMSESHLIKHFKQSNYNIAVVGSDQVWREEYSPNIDNFFLNFLNKEIRKVAYAASFGVEVWQFSVDKTNKIKNWLSEFDGISVREENAQKLCRENLEINVKHVLDPTLLLSIDDYKKFISKADSLNTNKIFAYILDKTDEKDKIVNKVSYIVGEGVFEMQPLKIYKDTLFVNNEEDYIYPKIENWIKSFYDASFIVTDSFHGTVFSIIFNKPFISIVNSERGATRFISLLKIFGLEKRLVYGLDEISDDLILESINYDEVNRILESERCKSFSFLKNQIDL